MNNSLLSSTVSNLKLVHRGKVRDIYEVDSNHLLMIATDRLSAFDVVLPTAIPQKGEILTELSNFWFEKTTHLIPNHLTHISVADVIDDSQECVAVGGRGVVVKKLTPLPIEAIVRGYLVGSGWKDYKRTGEVCGIKLPDNLQEAAQFPAPIFTPSTKAAVGVHDENIAFARAIELVGEAMANQVRDISIALYQFASAYALSRGIIIADTKFEFGLDDAGRLVLMDEIFTPDSSRFWPADQYQLGSPPPSFDKQFVRDYLESIAWDKNPPAPDLPEELAIKTAEKYREALVKLTREAA